MRIIRVKLEEDTVTYLRTLCRQFQIKDAPFIQDIHALVTTKGGGLPDDARCEALAKAYAKALGMTEGVVRTLIRKRRQVLTQLVASIPFAFYRKNPNNLHPRQVTEQLLDVFRKLYSKKRQAECLTCMYLTQCDFGRQYSAVTSTVGLVIDVDYAKKVHSSCPIRPELDITNQLASSLNTLTTMAQAGPNPGETLSGKKEANALAAAEVSAQQLAKMDPLDQDLENLPVNDDWEDDNERSFNPFSLSLENESIGLANSELHGHYVFLDPNLITQLSAQKFLIFELGRKLNSALAKVHTGKFKPTNETTGKSKTQNMQSASELSRVLPKEHAASDDAFFGKMARKELAVRKNQKQLPKKHLQYVLLDTSCSMCWQIASGGVWALLTRAVLAASFTLAISKLIASENGILYMRYFDNGVSDLFAAEADAEFETINKRIVALSFNGGGTNINAALTEAIKDISTAADRLRQAEILMVTDCGCQLTPQQVTTLSADLERHKIVLNILNVANSTDGYEVAAGQTLEKMADHYFQAKGQAKTIDSLVELIGGKKKGGVK